MARWSLEAAGVGLEAGLVPAAAAGAGMVEAGGPGPRRRPRRSSGSGCEVEAVVAEAVGRKEEGGRGRSLLALLLMDCPVRVEGAQRRAGLDSSGCGGEGVGAMW